MYQTKTYTVEKLWAAFLYTFFLGLLFPSAAGSGMYEIGFPASWAYYDGVRINNNLIGFFLNLALIYCIVTLIHEPIFSLLRRLDKNKYASFNH
jgi:hypothetical protein